MGAIEELNGLISDFNALVCRRLKAERWFDLPDTTDADREKWKFTIFKLIEDTRAKAKQLESKGFVMKPEFWWEGI